MGGWGIGEEMGGGEQSECVWCVWCVCGGVVLVGVNWTGHARLASGVSGMFAVKHAEGRK